jgi:hypothetical protein
MARAPDHDDDALLDMIAHALVEETQAAADHAPDSRQTMRSLLRGAVEHAIDRHREAIVGRVVDALLARLRAGE